MALPALQWRMLPPVVITSTAQPSFILDAIYTAGTSAVYADGSARVLGNYATPGAAGQVPTLPASGFAWTWNYDATTLSTIPNVEKTACYAVPASGALNQQLVLMGVNSSVAIGSLVWKQFVDARSQQELYVGHAKNSGVYTTFNSATTPFTTGDFTGYCACGNLTPTSGFTLLFMWESAEAVIIELRNAATSGQVSAAAFGAFVDPLSTNLANAETDGRLYGIHTTGSIAVVPAAWMSSAAGGELFAHGTSVGNGHFGTFTPGLGTVTTCTRAQTLTPSSAFVARNGDFPEIPYQIAGAASGAYIGQLRQIFVTRDSLTGITWEAAGVTKGYLLAASTLTATDAMLLTY